MEAGEIAVNDNTILNPAKAVCPSGKIRCEKRWGARVWQDRTKPGNMERLFFNKVEKGRKLRVAGVEPGQFLEFCHTIQTWAARGSTEARVYYLVHAVEDNRFIVEEVAAESIPPRYSSHDIVDNARYEVVIELKNENARLKKRVEQLECAFRKINKMLVRIALEAREEDIDLKLVEVKLCGVLHYLEKKLGSEVCNNSILGCILKLYRNVVRQR